jgi:hypothetical protein
MKIKGIFCSLSLLAQSFALAASDSDKAITIPSSPDMTLWKLLTDSGWVIIPLIIVSFIAVILILFCFFNLRSSRISSQALKQSLESKIQNKDFTEVW